MRDMSSKEASSKNKKKRRLEELDTEELVKKCVGIIDKARSSQSHNRSRRSHNSSGKENNNPQKKSRKSKKSEKSETSEISEDRACSNCSTRDSSAEENRKKSGEDKMADIAAALSGEETPAIGAPPVDSSRSEHSSFVDEWKRIVREGLCVKEVEEIAAKYRTTEDSVKELRAPELNAEVRSLVDSTTLKIDESYAARQNQSAVQLSVIDRVLGLIAERGKQSAEVARLVEYLHDFGRNNADIHHGISLARRHAIFSALNVNDVAAVEIQCEVGEKLFSRSMEMLLYKQKVRAEVEETVKPIVASFRENVEEIVKAIAADWEKDFFEKLKEVAADLKKDLAQTQNALVAPVGEDQGTEENTGGRGALEIAAKVEGVTSAKVEGARSAKVKASDGIAMSYVPSEREVYPGGAEVVKRASEQRGVRNTYSTLTISTRKSYEHHIKDWWYFCQRERKDVIEPLASDVLRFCEEQVSLGRSVHRLTTAMGHVLPVRVLRNPSIIRFFRDVKKEKI